MLNKAYSFEDIALVPNYCPFDSRKDVDISVDLGKGLILQVGIISSNMDTITGHEMANKMGELGGLGILHRFMSIEDNVTEYKKCKYQTGVSLGTNEGLDRAKALYDAGARIFCIDVAHGHSKGCGRMVKALREVYGEEVIIIAGNVCTYAGADYLVGTGADIIKVGIGPGSVCTTRLKTGFGVPQLTAIMNCSKCSKPIIGDGGIKTPSDAVKAFAGGAKAIMLGGMLAGTNETPGDLYKDYRTHAGDPFSETKKQYEEGCYKKFRGMASREAFEDMFGAMPDWKTAEGISTKVYCKGPVEIVIKDIVGGLRSGLTYCGAHNIDELRRRVEFVEITNAGRTESGAHI